MAYTGQIARILVSAPGDLGGDDLRVIFDTIASWTVREGAVHGVAFLPMHWSTDTAAEYGIRPQESINQQLVDRADVVIALFWTRLGTPTGEADSGTVEELTRAAEAGKYVAILRCRRPVDPVAIEVEQLNALESFFEEHRQSGLLKEYDDEHSLAREVSNVLLVAAGRTQADAQSSQASPVGGRPPRVWVTTHEETEARQDSKGRLKNHRRHFVVLTNSGDQAAYDVTVEFIGAADGPLQVADLDSPIAVLPPDSPMRFPAFVAMSDSRLVDCRVRWFVESAADGVDREQREQVSTVRF